FQALHDAVQAQGQMLGAQEQRLQQIACIMDEFVHSVQPNQSPAPAPSAASTVMLPVAGKALRWATAVWEAQGISMQSFSSFQQQFQEVFAITLLVERILVNNCYSYDKALLLPLTTRSPFAH
ncbi:hypothetical protein NFI96_008916, partial [Prochilodus magdalenae]